MNLKDIEGFVTAMESAGLARFVCTVGSEKLKLVRTPQVDGGAAAQPERVDRDAPAMETVSIRSPHTGCFQRAHPLDPQTAVEEGSPVFAGQVIGYVRVESVLFPVIAPIGARVERLLVADGTLVGYGEKLIEFGGDSIKANSTYTGNT